MKPYNARYTFRYKAGHRFRFFLDEQIGFISEFPQTWIETPTWEHARKRMPDSYYKNPPKYKRASLRIDGMPSISLEFVPELKNFMFGIFKNDAILLKTERSENEILKITIWFFKDMKQQAETLFNQWISCQLELDEVNW